MLFRSPSNESVSHSLIHRIDVVSADEMFEACHLFYKKVDIAILSAAVSDYKPVKVADEKIKKSEALLSINLEPTKDILASLGKSKTNQFLVGFALETQNEIENATSKLETKNLDLIVLNSLKDEGAGFQKSTNKVTIIDKSKKISEFSLKSKEAVAADIFDIIISKINE